MISFYYRKEYHYTKPQNGKKIKKEMLLTPKKHENTKTRKLGSIVMVFVLPLSHVPKFTRGDKK